MVIGLWWLVVVGLYFHFLVLRSIQTLEIFFLKMFTCKIFFVETNGTLKMFFLIVEISK